MRTWVVAVSATLHVAGLWALLHSGEKAGGTVDAPPIEVELIQQPDSVPGGKPGQEAPAAPVEPAPPPVPLPDQDGEPALEAARPQTQAASNPPAVDLGSANQQLEGALVTGRNIMPAQPDAAHRNLPPRYPAEAARRRKEGTVSLVIRVSARGVPNDVQVDVSSGDTSLDRAARTAVRLWRFIPAMDGDKPVPFDYAMDIRFVIGDAK